MTKAELVRSELAKLPQVEFLEDEGEAIVLCPFHSDHHPSLRVSLIEKVRNKSGGQTKKITPGNFHCWSCRAGGGWNNLAAKLGLTEWDQKEADNTPSDPFWSLYREHQAMAEGVHEYRKPATDGPWEEPWKTFSVKFLREWGAESLWDQKDEAYRIYLPVHDIDQKLVGHVGARPDNSTIPDKRKYVNSWQFPAEKVWYGLNRVKGNVAVVVEGPSDMLRFQSEGIPAIAAFGVSVLTEPKVFKLLAVGVNKVITCLDGDKPGRDATPYFTGEFRKQGLEVFDMDLRRYGEGKIDPGNCPIEAVNDLKAFLETL